MEEKELTPDESFQLITSIIQEAKIKFEEDGLVYVMWGALVAFAAFAQYYLLNAGYEDINYYPYFLMPLGGIFSAIYYSRKETKSIKTSHLAKIISTMWIAIGINILVIAFGFAIALGPGLIPIILVLTGIGITVSGRILRYNLLFYAGLAMNIFGIIGFSIDYGQQPLLLGITNLLCVLLPGLMLMIRHKKK